jgi:hypothetical protein
MSIFDSSPSGYWIQEPKAPEGVLADLRDLGVKRPVEPFDGLDESMPPESLRIVAQVGCEMLAKLAGFGLGDYLTADIVNRGLLAYLRQREALRKAAEMGA